MTAGIRKIIDVVKSNPIYFYILCYAFFLILLSLFRHASADETYYLKETVLISELIKAGRWIGDYGVGLHGFLFKVPVAILFLIIGKPSVFIATLFTIILSVLSLFLFYYLAKRVLRKEDQSFWALILFSMVLYFANSSLTFNRDIPAVFSVLLFLVLFFRGVNTWLIGFSLLLLLDAKEHVFFTVAPFFALYVIIEQLYFIRRRKIGIALKKIISKLFAGYSLSIVWILLMFITSIIPVNMFIASIGGGIDAGIQWSTSQFKSSVATENLVSNDKKEIPKLQGIAKSAGICNIEITSEFDNNITRGGEKLLCEIAEGLDLILAYIGKVLYPRTFSFISIPKIIVLPATVFSISLLVTWFRQKDKRVILPLVLLFNILILILRASHGRYLLCVTPLFILFFILFLTEGIKKKYYFRNVFIATTIFVVSGFLLESSFVFYKVLLESLLLILLWLVWFTRRDKRRMYGASRLFFSILGMGMLLVILSFSYKIGQISSYLKYGYNREAAEIVKHIPTEEKIWINDFGSGELISFYRKDVYINPEWAWELKQIIPKKKLLRTYSEPKTYSFDILDMKNFNEELVKKDISTIVMVVSTIADDSFTNQEILTELIRQEWIVLTNETKLKNKVVYIFNLR